MSGITQIALTSWVGVVCLIGLFDPVRVWNYGFGQCFLVVWQSINTACFVVATNKAFKLAPATVLMPFEHLSLPLGFLVGVLFFGESLTLSVVLGGGAIVLSSLFYMMHLPDTSRFS